LAALLQGQTPPNVLSEEGQAEPAIAAPKPKARLKKGDPRIIVTLSELEIAVFGDRKDVSKVFGRKKNRAARGAPEPAEWKTVDMEDHAPGSENTQQDTTDNDEETAGTLTDDSLDEQLGGVSINDHVRAPQSQSDVNFSVGGERGWSEKIDETPEMLAKRREGQKRADEKELVKRVARRAVAFGLLIDAPPEPVVGKKGKKGAQDRPERETVKRKCEALMNGQVVEPSFAKGDWSIRWRED